MTHQVTNRWLPARSIINGATSISELPKSYQKQFMAKEVSNPAQWREPEKGENAGIGSWNRPKLHDNFMESQGILIHRGIGVHRVQYLPLKPEAAWRSGTFIQLYGTEGLWGCYVVEVPAQTRSIRNVTCMSRFTCYRGPGHHGIGSMAQ